MLKSLIDLSFCSLLPKMILSKIDFFLLLTFSSYFLKDLPKANSSLFCLIIYQFHFVKSNFSLLKIIHYFLDIYLVYFLSNYKSLSYLYYLILSLNCLRVYMETYIDLVFLVKFILYYFDFNINFAFNLDFI